MKLGMNIMGMYLTCTLATTGSLSVLTRPFGAESRCLGTSVTENVLCLIARKKRVQGQHMDVVGAKWPGGLFGYFEQLELALLATRTLANCPMVE